MTNKATLFGAVINVSPFKITLCEDVHICIRYHITCISQILNGCYSTHGGDNKMNDAFRVH